MENLEDQLFCLKKIKIHQILSRPIPNTEDIMEYFYSLSSVLSQLNLFRDAIETISKAGKYYEKLNGERQFYWKATHQYELAYNYLEIGELYQAQKHAKLSSDYFQKLQSADGLATALDISSLVELSMHNYDQAIGLAKQSLQIRSEFDKKQLNISYNNLGEIYRTMGNFKESMEYYEKAKLVSIEKKDKVSEAIAYNNLGLVFFNLGKMEKSTELFEESQKIFTTLKVFDVECSLDYSRVLIQSKRIYEALKILTNVHKHLEQNKSNKNLCRYYLVMGKAQIQLRNLGNAYEHLALAREIAEFSEFPFLNIEINLKLVEASFLFARIEEKEKWFNEANDWLSMTETLVIEVKQPQLLLELKFLRSLLYKERGEENKAVRSLMSILESNIIEDFPELKNRVENVIQAIEESDPLTEVDILIYLDRIAQMVETAKH
ncbi:MAG: tetratricopeptide repeat protein [Candidatus Hodarchaeales archaeon]|jgi:tetratricopeptide (TPR) repeat protein